MRRHNYIKAVKERTFKHTIVETDGSVTEEPCYKITVGNVSKAGNLMCTSIGELTIDDLITLRNTINKLINK